MQIPRASVFLMLAAAMHCQARRSAEKAQSQVVFVCEHGAAKSVIAAAYFNQLSAERGTSLRAVARGSDPQPEPSTTAVAGLRGDGLEAAPTNPQPVTGGDVRTSFQVVAFDCLEPAMRPLSAMGMCWNDVPELANGYHPVRDSIRTHVAALLDQLVADGAGR
jgi:arsenate reductase (thioredoxin)